MGVPTPSVWLEWAELERSRNFVSLEGAKDLRPSFCSENHPAILEADLDSQGNDSQSRMAANIRFSRSLSFKNWENGDVILSADQDIKSERKIEPSVGRSLRGAVHEINLRECCLSPRLTNDQDAAALKLQKVYKSYRTRRNLADCAVVVEELWWRWADFASLKHSSISFFHDGKPESAASRWARARTRAAKVGKGLSKNHKAQKLALQHWLEAIDPRHRYGHNLHLYYDVWFKSESTQPFFYWLDIGDGKDINLEKCPRNRLQKQCVKYLGPKERQAYEVIVEEGKLVYKQNGKLVDTTDGSKWIFVLSTYRALYIGQKRKGIFHHSSFLAGGATTASGRLAVKEGNLKAIWPYSGHYLPTEDNFQEFMNFLEENNVDLTDVKRSSVDENDEYPSSRTSDSDVAIESRSSSEFATESTSIKAGNSSETEAEDVPLEHPKAESDEIQSSKNDTELHDHHSRKWSTGAGPRIRCVRHYPSDLQCKALEQVNLSPRPTNSPQGNVDPIPSPRPSPAIKISPGLANMQFPSAAISLTLPNLKKEMISLF